MIRHRLFLPVATLSAAIALAACGGSSATTAPTGQTAPTGAPTAPAVATPAATATKAPGATTAPGPTLSFAPDTDLAAKFPTTVDGQPVTDVQTALYLDFLKLGATADELQHAIDVLNGVGIDLTRMTFGSGTATVDGDEVNIVALRTPGADASKIIQNYGVLGNVFGTTADAPPTMTQATIGGKNVTVATDADEEVIVLYVNGDTLFLLEHLTDSQNTKILQALR